MDILYEVVFTEGSTYEAFKLLSRCLLSGASGSNSFKVMEVWQELAVTED